MSVTRRLSKVLNNVYSRSFCTKSKKESPLKSILENATLYDELRVKSEWATQPYVRLPADHTEEKTLNPLESTIVLFPGQGTQYIGMGKNLFKYPGVNDIYECASEIAGFNLKNIATEKELQKYCQLAIVTASLAALEQVREERPSVLENCVATAGFSLGEITALIFSGALSFEDGLKIVNLRNLAMEAASRDHPGGMLRIMFYADANIQLGLEDAKEYCVSECNMSDPVCSVANYLFPQCKVLSGSEKAIQFLEQNGRKYGIHHAKRIKVSGAFHSEVMRPAVEPLRQALTYCKIDKPKISTYSATSCKKYRHPRDLISILPKQLTQPVKWEQLMHAIYTRPRNVDFPKTYEVGPGNTLRSILRKVNAPAWDNSISIFE